MKYGLICLTVLMLVSSTQADTNVASQVQRALRKGGQAVVVLKDGHKITAYVSWEKEKKVFRILPGSATLLRLAPAQISTFEIPKGAGTPEFTAAWSNALCNLLIRELKVEQWGRAVAQ